MTTSHGSRLVDRDKERHPVGADIEHAGFGIDRRAGPVGAAGDRRAPGSCRAATAACTAGRDRMCRNDVDRLLADLRREVDQVLLAHALDVERRRLGRKRLGLRRALAGHAGGRHRPLLDRPHRFAGDAVEHVDEGLLGHLRHRLDRACPSTVMSIRLGAAGGVVVPQPVMDELVVPDLLAGRRVEADEAVAIEAVARAGGRHNSRWSAC